MVENTPQVTSNHEWEKSMDEVLIPNAVHFTLENWHCKNCPAHVVHIPGALPPYVSPLYHSECVGNNDVVKTEQDKTTTEQPEQDEDKEPSNTVDNPQTTPEQEQNQQAVEQHSFPWQN